MRRTGFRSGGRRAWAIGILIAGCVATSAMGPVAHAAIQAPATVSTVTATRDRATDERTFVSLINGERTRRGLGALTVRADLVAAARRQSVRMAPRLDIWHNLNLENEISGWLDIGENVGWSWGTAADLHEAFMESPEHRDNILFPRFNEIGIGEAIGSDGRIFVTETFANRTQLRSAAPRHAAPNVAPRRLVHRTPNVADTPRTVTVLLEIVALA